MAKPPKLVALDFYFLKNWVREAPHHAQALAFFNACGFTPVILPIVESAINDLRGDADTKAHLRRIKEEIDDSLIEILSYEREIDREANMINGTRVAEKGILPGAIAADTILLAEAAFFDVFAFLTPRPCFTGAASASIKVALLDCGFSQSVVIFSPREIGNYMLEREKRSQV